MHSIAPVRSAGGAATYFAKDNYYTAEQNAEGGVWGGLGARELGLEGVVEPQIFERLLNGELPSGEKVGQVEGRRPGLDLTFSMPKSASVMAYIGGDGRVIEANMRAVQKTMAFVEQRYAEGRTYDRNRHGEPERTGKLVYALFPHDTSRALDPQAHIHAVVANLTRMADGSWKALWNGEIWKNNTVIGQVYHAALRAELQKLGYETEAVGKHGAFEIKGVSKEVRDEFSRRPLEIDAKVKELGVTSPAGKKLVTLATRDPKLDVSDRDALLQDWKDRAQALGFDGNPLHRAAMARIALSGRPNFIETSNAALSDLKERIGGLFRARDPLVTSGMAAVFMPAERLKAQHAVASSIRHLSEREAAFSQGDIVRAALGFQIKGLEVEPVLNRVTELLASGALIAGQSHRADGQFDLVTTPAALKMEQAILDTIHEGKGQGRVLIAPGGVLAKLQQASGDRLLNEGQTSAAVRILSGSDRMTLVQGVAGAGKSTMIAAVAGVAAGEGIRVLGLAFQNKMVADLRDTGIEAQTIASFVNRFASAAHEGSGPKFEAARSELRNTILLVDESSMVSSRDMLTLTEIAQKLSVDGLHFIGDRQQLSAIEQGKSFAVAQAAGAPMVRMDENIRQRSSPLLLAVAGLSNVGFAGQALDLLAAHDRVIEDKKDHVGAAAKLWLDLGKEGRERTAIFTAGRDDRARINTLIQDGLLKEGTLSGVGLPVTVLQGVNNSREELRHTSTYQVGQVLEARSRVSEIGLPKGSYAVSGIDARGRVTLRDGKQAIRFDPQKIDPANRQDRISLSERVSLKLHDGETILWREHDKPRDIVKSTYAKIVKADGQGVTVELADKRQLRLPTGDPMLARLDLGYALNAHMAQGMTKPEAIEVIGSYQRNLATQRTQNVLNTRATDDVRVVTDDLGRLKLQLDRTPGNKTSALEAVGRIEVDRKPSDPFAKRDLPPLAMSPELKAKVEAVMPTPEPKMLPVPEKKLGLDLA
ncbi:MAG: conjugative relaxase [Sphingomonadales bacterium]|nr:conjugative relaxase [Sphingomonadales bacterium]